ncbi:MAG: hypothetical protein KJ729_02245, partial [Euryarchaeota archaeon]|nr:hypothetical protein [Euryarchaeota archaeon]
MLQEIDKNSNYIEDPVRLIMIYKILLDFKPRYAITIKKITINAMYMRFKITSLPAGLISVPF